MFIQFQIDQQRLNVIFFPLRFSKGSEGSGGAGAGGESGTEDEDMGVDSDADSDGDEDLPLEMEEAPRTAKVYCLITIIIDIFLQFSLV